MKEKDLYIDFEPQQLIYYVEKDDNTYGPIKSGSQLSANYLDDFWQKRKKLEADLRKQIIDNKISPVYYYMIIQEMGSKDLAKRIGISHRRLKKIFKPEHFKKLNIEKLKKIAETFNIPVALLFQSFLIKDTDQEKLVVEQTATQNELFHITKIRVK